MTVVLFVGAEVDVAAVGVAGLPGLTVARLVGSDVEVEGDPGADGKLGAGAESEGGRFVAVLKVVFVGEAAGLVVRGALVMARRRARNISSV